MALYSLLLFERREISLTELANELKCSKQAAGRLLDQVEGSRFGKLIREKRGREAVYRLAKPSRLPQITLDAEGLRQLALCRDLVLHLLPATMRKRVDATLQQATAYAAQEDEDIERLPTKIFTKGYIDYTPYQGMIDTLLRAIREQKVCIVRYQARRHQEPREFEFAPKRLDSLRESMFINGWVVTEKGRAEAKGEKPTIMALQRFHEVTLTRRSAAHLPEVPPGESDGFGIINFEPFRVRTRIDKKAATYAAERIWSPDQKITDNEDGSIILEITAHNEYEVVSWVLSFDTAAEVLEPKWLREKMAETVKSLAKRYGNITA